MISTLGLTVAATLAVGIGLGAITVLVARRWVVVATALGPAVAVACVAAGVFVGVRTMSIDPASMRTITVVLVASVPIALLAGCGTAVHSWRQEKLRAAEDEQRRRQAELETSRKEMITWISHDLRTPLAGIRAMTEALQDGMARDPQTYLARIHSEAERTAAMVDDLLSLSNAHAGISSQAGPIDISDLISDTLATAKAVSAGVRVTGSAPHGLTVIGDIALLSRALWNLVTNAIAHTPPGGEVQVQASGDAARVSISVADQCGGIPHDDLPHVFEAGWRGTTSRSPATSGDSGGAGLGLAIVAAVVELFHGAVSVVNTETGCQFTMTMSGWNEDRVEGPWGDG